MLQFELSVLHDTTKFISESVSLLEKSRWEIPFQNCHEPEAIAFTCYMPTKVGLWRAFWKKVSKCFCLSSMASNRWRRVLAADWFIRFIKRLNYVSNLYHGFLLIYSTHWSVLEKLHFFLRDFDLDYQFPL